MKRFVVVFVLVVGCEAAVTPGHGCTRTSDCPSGLVCAIGRCRAGCVTSDDCGPLGRCLLDPRTMTGACSLAVDSCATHDCALGFVCRDDQCLNACGTLVGCPDRVCDDGACVPTHGDAGVPEGDGGAPATGVVRVMAGNKHFCAVTAAGALWCWGDASHGALGDGVIAHGDCDGCSDVPTQALDHRGTPLANVGLVSGAQGFTCATIDGDVACWGSGPLGALHATSSLAPVLAEVTTDGVLGPVSDTTMLSAGADHVCAVWGAASEIVCWGAGPNGQLGDGTTTVQSDRAVTATELGTMPLALSASQHHTIILDASGNLHGVGLNSALECGSFAPADAVMATDPIYPRARLMVSNGPHTCFVGADDGALHCIGGQFLALLGPEPIADLTPCVLGTCTATPTTTSPPNGETIAALGMTLRAACIALGTGDVWCLGEGGIMEATSTTLVRVASLHDVTALAGSDDAMCALTRDGHVRCWGSNELGQLGRGTHDDGASTTPMLVPIP